MSAARAAHICCLFTNTGEFSKDTIIAHMCGGLMRRHMFSIDEKN